MRFNSQTPTFQEAQQSATRIIVTLSLWPKRIQEGPYRWFEKSYILQTARVSHVDCGLSKIRYWEDTRWALGPLDYDVSPELMKNKC